MRTWILSPILACVLFHASSVHAKGGAVIIESESKRTYTHPYPHMDERLSEVGFWTQRYRIPSTTKAGKAEDSFGSQFYAWYEVKKPEDAEKFVFVQLIRGCIFDTHVEEGRLVTAHKNMRKHFDAYIPFVHTRWALDSTDNDPVYWSEGGDNTSRHQILRIGGTGTKFPDQPATYDAYGDGEKKHNRLFITDFPTAASLRWNPYQERYIATNTSMQFRTCLYRVEDVPTKAQPEDVEFGQPIVCFFWDNSYVFTEDMRTVHSPTKLESACLKEEDVG